MNTNAPNLARAPNDQTKWKALEHRIYRQAQAEALLGKKLLVMVSGGMDSVALLKIAQRLSSALRWSLSVLHIHHGDGPDSRQNEFRQQAAEFVERICDREKLDYYLEKANQPLSSENDFRQFRKSVVEENLRRSGCDLSVWAHHENDFIETQFLRLIRGSGIDALAQPMVFLRNREMRPLLGISRQEIADYSQEFKLDWINDPSNTLNDPLRNWLRNEWLPQLENRQPGALRAFARSLVLLHENHEFQLPTGFWLDPNDRKRISKSVFDQMLGSERRAAIVVVYQQEKIFHFSNNHILEVMKQLDKAEKEHRFTVAHLTWTVGSGVIEISGEV